MAPTSLRLPADVDASLPAWCERTGSSRSAAVTTALREWLAAQRHPGIVFRRALDGERRPALEGGPEVWAVVDAWLERHRRVQEEELAAWERRQALATA